MMILHEPQMIAEGIWSIAGIMTDIETPKYLEKNLFQCHSVPPPPQALHRLPSHQIGLLQ
jgi:hypothetical protein